VIRIEVANILACIILPIFLIRVLQINMLIISDKHIENLNKV
jgi:hypothetical protein